MNEIRRDLENAHLDQLIERWLVAHGTNLFYFFRIDMLHAQGNQLARIRSCVTERSQASDIVWIYVENTQRNEVPGIKTAHARSLQGANPSNPNVEERVGLQLLCFKIAKSQVQHAVYKGRIGYECKSTAHPAVMYRTGAGDGACFGANPGVQMCAFTLQICECKAGKRAQRLLSLRGRTVSIAFAPTALQVKIRLGLIRIGGDAARSGERSKLLLRLQKQAGEGCQGYEKHNPACLCHFAPLSESPITPEMRSFTSCSIDSELKP